MIDRIILHSRNFHKINLFPIISNGPVEQFHLQTTFSSSSTSEKVSSKTEWKNAKPFEELPPNSGISLMFDFLPGGKYYKMDPITLMLALKEDVGPIARFKGMFGKKDTVVTHNVDDFSKVLRNEGIWPRRSKMEAIHYHRNVHRADFFQGVGSLLTADGEKWANFRSIVNPVLMHPKNVKMYLHKMSQVNKEFVERIREIRDPQTLEVPANFDEEINRWTLESVSVVALDKQLGCINTNHDDPLVKGLFKAVNDFFKYGLEVEMKPPIWKYYKTKSFKNLMTSLDSITNITSTYINETMERLEQEQREGKLEKPEYDKSVLEKLLKIDRKIAKVMAMDMLMAGVDTTSSTFAGLLLCLAKNPSKQAKLREEIRKILPNKDSEFDEDSFNNMPYLRACIKESLRMYPITLGVSRVIANDVVLSGYRIPKNTVVVMVSISLVNDELHFPQPKEFLPERWLRTDKGNSECPRSLKTNNPFVYLPFGFGSRSCIGRRIVELELELGIARIIRNFHVEYNHPTENAFKCLLINVPNIPLTFRFSDIAN